MPPSETILRYRLGGLEGRRLLTAQEALVKGALESELEIGVIAGPQTAPFVTLFEIPADEQARALLGQHRLQIVPAADASRGVAIALDVARSGGRAIALVPNDQLDHALETLHEASGARLPSGAGLCLLLEDRGGNGLACPREAALRMELPCLEPADVEQLRDGVEQTLQLSGAGRRAVAMTVHNSILRLADTVAVGPNRVVDVADMVVVRRSAAARKERRVATGGILRTARLWELNRGLALPSPGERVPIGFVVVGPAEAAVRHLTGLLRLSGRVPLMQLRLINPVDQAALERILPRCEQVIVLEPRPGVIETRVLAVAEQLRHRGQRVATIWGRSLPPDTSGAGHAMASHRDLHPSILARKIAHLLHTVRPMSQMASHFVPDPPAVEADLPPRGAKLGFPAARAVAERVLEDVDGWLRDGAHQDDEERLEPTPEGLVIGGVGPADDGRRLVVAEVWDPRRFQADGLGALQQAARDDRPWIFMICDVRSDSTQDLERLARAVIPEGNADRVRIVLAPLDDTVALREQLREAALANRLTVVIARDGPPSRFDAAAIERSLHEIDRLGFEPQLRVVWSADQACAFREPRDDLFNEQQVARSRQLHTTFSVERLPARLAGRLRFGIRPLLESVEVRRTRPPAQMSRRMLSVGLPLPNATHAEQSEWRVHLAGTRGESPGPVATALCAAAGVFIYVVRCEHDETPIGAGRRAWAQILFTNPRADEPSPTQTPRIPFGEADLLLGLDAAETMRAVALDPDLRVAYVDRTAAVVNRGIFSDDQGGRGRDQVVETLEPLLPQLTRDGHHVVEDVAAACRAWFRTDRVTDMALLGIAFQRGEIPVTIEAIEQGIRRVEARAYAQSFEAFQFGRRLAVDGRLLNRPRPGDEEDLAIAVRRAGLLLRRTRFSGATRAQRFRELVEASLEAMPGLTETEPGRQARRDLVNAVRRCIEWGGLDYAQKYCDLVTSVYQADRGERGRAVTRNSILSLAEVMLIRDPLYVLTMATGLAQNRRTRQRLGVKGARGDVMTRRYLSRVELVAAGRRFRFDVRTGDGIARLVASLRHVVPVAWRGSARHRELRQYVTDVIERAARGARTDYDHWLGVTQTLHRLAAEDMLRGIAVAELRRILEPPTESPEPPDIEVEESSSSRPRRSRRAVRSAPPSGPPSYT